MDLIIKWVLNQGVKGLTHQVVREPERTPVILFEVPAHQCDLPNTVLIYGHMDKQPPMTEAWAPGLHPRQPVIRNGKLYGRGGADDGYSAFAAITAIRALQDQGVSHPRIVVLIEGSEESGSPDLNHYLAKLSPGFGNVGLIVCLDSGCGNYDQLWVTTSLRGVMSATARIDVLQHGVHSGAASGIVPSSFRCMRVLLDHIEDSKTGQVLLKDLWVDIPKHRIEEAKSCAEVMGDGVFKEYPFVDGVKPVTSDRTEALLNKTWRPQLAVIGQDGIPIVSSAGNVIRAQTTLKLSVRLPPTKDPKEAVEIFKKHVESVKLPCDATVKLHVEASTGWNAPDPAAWLTDSLQKASKDFWGKPAVSFGEGGSIPFMGLLGRTFPNAQFMIVGLLGPDSNAHGPDESMDIAFAKNLSGAVAHVIFDMAHHK